MDHSAEDLDFQVDFEREKIALGVLLVRFHALIARSHLEIADAALLAEARMLERELISIEENFSYAARLERSCELMHEFIVNVAPRTEPRSELIQIVREAIEQSRRILLMVQRAPVAEIAIAQGSIESRYRLKKAQYDFRGSSVLIMGVFGSFVALRYFDIIGLSWLVVWPLATLASVFAASLVSTLVHGHNKE